MIGNLQKRIVDFVMIVLLYVILLSVCLFRRILLVLPLLLTDCCGSLPYDVSIHVLGNRSIWHMREGHLRFPTNGNDIFCIERSHYFVDFALKTQVYDRLVDLCT